jgi:hypothetical protein
MARICSWCKKEMKMGVKDCTGNVVEFPDGKKMDAIPYEDEGNCHDCGVRSGGRHHVGCDMETCPRCHGQLIGCGCLDKPEDDEDE